jgi:hypothetical protein
MLVGEVNLPGLWGLQRAIGVRNSMEESVLRANGARNSMGEPVLRTNQVMSPMGEELVSSE